MQELQSPLMAGLVLRSWRPASSAGVHWKGEASVLPQALASHSTSAFMMFRPDGESGPSHSVAQASSPGVQSARHKRY